MRPLVNSTRLKQFDIQGFVVMNGWHCREVHPLLYMIQRNDMTGHDMGLLTKYAVRRESGRKTIVTMVNSRLEVLTHFNMTRIHRQGYCSHNIVHLVGFRLVKQQLSQNTGANLCGLTLKA